MAALISEPGGESSADKERRSPFRRLLDLVFGYDFFISYAWDDGAHYAEQLARRLEQDGFDVFLDRDDYAPGDDWQRVGGWTLRRTGQLILVGSPLALRSEPVERELGMFAKTGRRIVPIDFGGSLDGLEPSNPVARHLPPQLLRIRESAVALESGPSDDTLARIRRTFTIIRQDKKRVRALALVATVLALLSVVAAIFGVSARASAAQAKDALATADSARARADQARARAVRDRDWAQMQQLLAGMAQAKAMRQQGIAEEQRGLAETQRDIARAAQKAERRARIRADQSAREARAEADASAAYALSDRDPTLALRFAERASKASSSATADLALLRAYNSGSWFYSHHFPAAVDAAVSPDERKLAWLGDGQLHLVDLDSGRERQWPDNAVHVAIAENGSIATWSAPGDIDDFGNYRSLIVRRGDGEVILPRNSPESAFRVIGPCGRDKLLAYKDRSAQQPELMFALVDIRTLQPELTPVPEKMPFDRHACSNDGETVVFAGQAPYFSEGAGRWETRPALALIRFHGAAATMPGLQSDATSIDVDPEGNRAALYFPGNSDPDRPDVPDRVGLINLREADPALEVIELPPTLPHGHKGIVRFLDSENVLAASAHGWVRIARVLSHDSWDLNIQGSSVQQIALSPDGGDFALARDAGSVVLYDAGYRRGGSLIGLTETESALKPTFRRIIFGGSRNSILTVSSQEGALLWHRPRLSLFVRPRGDGYDHSLPEEFRRASQSHGQSPQFTGGSCGKFGKAVQDDDRYMSLCVMLNGHPYLLPSYLRPEEFGGFWGSASVGPIASHYEHGPVQALTGDDLARIFVLDPHVVVEEIRNNRDILPLSKIANPFEKR